MDKIEPFTEICADMGDRFEHIETFKISNDGAERFLIKTEYKEKQEKREDIIRR